MTPQRLAEIRARSFATTPLDRNIGFCGLSAEEADELLVEVLGHEAAMKGKTVEVHSLREEMGALNTTTRNLRRLVDSEIETVARKTKEYERLVDKYRRLVTWLNRHKVGGWEAAVED